MGSGNSPSPSWRSGPLSPLPCCWLRPKAPPCSQPLLSNWRHPFQPPEPPDRAPLAQWPKYRWKLPSFFPFLLTLHPQSRVISLLVIVRPRFSQTTVKGNCGHHFPFGILISLDFSVRSLKSPGQAVTAVPSPHTPLVSPPASPFLSSHCGADLSLPLPWPRGLDVLLFSSTCLLLRALLTVFPCSFGLPRFIDFNLSVMCLGAFCLLRPRHSLHSPRRTQFQCAPIRQTSSAFTGSASNPTCFRAISSLAFASL